MKLSSFLVGLFLATLASGSLTASDDSINIMPGGGFQHADGLYSMLRTNEVVLVIEKSSRDPAVVRWMEKNGFSLDDRINFYTAALKQIGLKVLNLYWFSLTMSIDELE